MTDTYPLVTSSRCTTPPPRLLNTTVDSNSPNVGSMSWKCPGVNIKVGAKRVYALWSAFILYYSTMHGLHKIGWVSINIRSGHTTLNQRQWRWSNIATTSRAWRGYMPKLSYTYNQMKDDPYKMVWQHRKSEKILKKLFYFQALRNQKQDYRWLHICYGSTTIINSLVLQCGDRF